MCPSSSTRVHGAKPGRKGALLPSGGQPSEQQGASRGRQAVFLPLAKGTSFHCSWPSPQGLGSCSFLSLGNFFRLPGGTCLLIL